MLCFFRNQFRLLKNSNKIIYLFLTLNFLTHYVFFFLSMHQRNENVFRILASLTVSPFPSLGGPLRSTPKLPMRATNNFLSIHRLWSRTTGNDSVVHCHVGRTVISMKIGLILRDRTKVNISEYITNLHTLCALDLFINSISSLTSQTMIQSIIARQYCHRNCSRNCFFPNLILIFANLFFNSTFFHSNLLFVS